MPDVYSSHQANPTRCGAPPRESRFSSLYRNKLVVQSGHERQSKTKQPFLQDRETVKGRRTFLHCSTLTTLTTYTFARAHTKTPFCQPFANNTARKMRPLLAAVAAEARVMSSCLIVGCLHYPQAAQAPGVPRGWGELAEKRPILPRGSRARGPLRVGPRLRGCSRFIQSAIMSSNL